MHFHLPKPLHGWRALVGEVCIIVVGVLIALGAEQAVEALHWRSEVSELRSAMRFELGVNRARTEQNLAEDHCTLARLDSIERWASTSPQGSRISKLDQPSLWNNHSSTWDLAKSSPATTHFGLNERLAYAGAYDSVINEQRYLFDEQDNWHQLAASLASADKPQNRALIDREVASARLNVNNREFNAAFLLQKLNALGIAADRRVAGIPTDVSRLCRPLAA